MKSHAGAEPVANGQGWVTKCGCFVLSLHLSREPTCRRCQVAMERDTQTPSPVSDGLAGAGGRPEGHGSGTDGTPVIGVAHA